MNSQAVNLNKIIFVNEIIQQLVVSEFNNTYRLPAHLI